MFFLDKAHPFPLLTSDEAYSFASFGPGLALQRHIFFSQRSAVYDEQ